MDVLQRKHSTEDFSFTVLDPLSDWLCAELLISFFLAPPD
jgi:hypothetical protein